MRAAGAATVAAAANAGVFVHSHHHIERAAHGTSTPTCHQGHPPPFYARKQSRFAFVMASFCCYRSAFCLFRSRLKSREYFRQTRYSRRLAG